MINSTGWKQLKPGKLMPGKLRIIDQTKLPGEVVYIETDSAEEIYNSIKRMAVRGAPAIGCAAALGLGAVCQHSDAVSRDEFVQEVKKTAAYLNNSRPTAVNLSWSLNRCLKKIEESAETDIFLLKELLIEEGIEILNEDCNLCKCIGEHGAKLLKDGYGMLTHCNAGGLATGGPYGTALAPAYIANENGLKITVYSDETRPLLQGSRLTAWELMKNRVNVVTICDNMAAQVMKEGRIDIVIVGSDRIAANGDAANKIGSYGLSILADYHKIPFYIAAPYSTIDPSVENGDEIPIEQRNADEIKRGFGKLTAPKEVNVYNPAFDVIPNELIHGIITEEGILRPPFKDSIYKLLKNKK
ncbi:MAG: S-methyl-5-thioribose-1-phosphate isomerase [Victivallales bacterium]|nr:S-methyl-5-thioribose-1-phosphate isomerase [Victivallales bacterium]